LLNVKLVGASRNKKVNVYVQRKWAILVIEERWQPIGRWGLLRFKTGN
jgi:hypothetical protein